MNLLQVLMQGNSNLTAIPAGLFDPLPKLGNAYLFDNGLTTLPSGLFDNNPSLGLVLLTTTG